MAKKSQLNQAGIRKLLKSQELQDGLLDIAEKMIAGNSRYEAVEDDSRQVRAAIRIQDTNLDAIGHEARTGALGIMAKKQV